MVAGLQETSVSVLKQVRTGIVGPLVRTVRSFFFEHPMATYAAALAYRGLFGLFPFVFILVVLLGALGIPDFFDRAMDQARAQSSQYVPQQLEPVVEPAREQVQPLVGMIERAEEQAGGKLLLFAVAVALWSVSAVARTLTEAFNVAYQVTETRRWWSQLALSLAFGPVLALVVIVSIALMLIGPQLVGSIAELVGLDEVFVRLWGWLRFPVALLLLATVLSVVYRLGPNARQRFRSVVPGAALCVVLWAISSVGFSFYLANFANYGVTYGSIGAAVGLLFYLYLCASVVLLGAELNAAIYHPDYGRNKGTKTVGNESKEDIDVSNESRYQQRLSTFAANWRALALRGLVALLFGLVVLFWPSLVLTVLALLFGIYAAVDGAITFVPALRSPDRGAQRSLPLAEGAVGIIAGLVALLWPGLTASGLVYVIAGWAVVTGVLKILTAILLRAEVQNGWLLAGSGALSALFGILLVVLARSDVPFLAPFIGGFAVVVGLALIVFAFRLRERRPIDLPEPLPTA